MGFLREPSHLLVIGVLVILLFGYKRLPDASRSIARSMRIFKSEIKQMKDDDTPKKPGSTEPIEGRVVDAEQLRDRPNATTPSTDVRRDI